MENMSARNVSRLIGLLAISLAVNVMAKSEHKPVETHQWFPTGIGQIEGAVAYGDMNKGEHGTYLKIPKGFATPIHSHTNGYRGVVLTGTVVNSEVGQPDIPLQAGSYWFQEGRKKHVTKCVSDTDCMVFLSQRAKFDFIEDKTNATK